MTGTDTKQVTRHTPGPWVAGKAGATERWFVEIDPDGTQTIAAVYGTDAEHDARLIAAAPEMLAALRAVVEEWREGYGLRCVDEVRAAIAKATGEQS